MSVKLKPPPGFKFDPFADVKMGCSLFEMDDSDWLVPDDRPLERTDTGHGQDKQS